MPAISASPIETAMDFACNEASSEHLIGKAIEFSYDWYRVCNSAKWMQTMQRANRCAPARDPIVIAGECGVGKRQMADYIISLSQVNRTVRIACGKLATELAAGVQQTWMDWSSTVHQAHSQHNYAWLLEDIDQIPINYQSLMLDLVSAVRRSGTSVIVSTSKKTLLELVESRQIREELYYALAVLDLSVPALRERPDDIISLSSFFANIPMNEGCRIINLTRQATEILVNYDWPGNVTELRNAISRIRVLADRTVIDSDQLQDIWRIRRRATADFSTLSLEEVERQLILKAVERMDGNKTAAARQLGITPRTLHNKMQKYRSLGLTDALPSKPKAA